MTVLYHQSMRLLRRLQDHCQEQPEHTPERERALRLSRRAYNRACRRWDQWQTFQYRPPYREEAIQDAISEESARA